MHWNLSRLCFPVAHVYLPLAATGLRGSSFAPLPLPEENRPPGRGLPGHIPKPESAQAKENVGVAPPRHPRRFAKRDKHAHASHDNGQNQAHSIRTAHEYTAGHANRQTEDVDEAVKLSL